MDLRTAADSESLAKLYQPAALLVHIHRLIAEKQDLVLRQRQMQFFDLTVAERFG